MIADFDVQNLIKYTLEGMAVAVVAKVVLGDRITPEEVLMLGLTASAAFAVLDHFSKNVGVGARLGAGFAIGSKLIGGGESQFSGEDIDELRGLPGYNEAYRNY